MATPSTQLDRTAIQDQVQEILAQLLAELGNPALAQLSQSSHLDRDLGLGSLERVELMLRLGAAFGAHLPDHIVAEADTVDDLVVAVAAAIARKPEQLENFFSRAAVARAATVGSALHETSFSRFDTAETLLDFLRHRGRSDARRPHIFLREDHPDGSGQARTRTITYGELLDAATSVARALEHRGIGRGDTVAIMLPTCAEFFSTFFGVMQAGAIPVPIYPPFRADRIEEYAARQAAILRNAEARLLVTFRQAEPIARLLKPRVPSLEGVAVASRLAESGAQLGETPAPKVHGDDIAFLQYTSGSTGDPKGVVLTHSSLLASIRAMGEAVALRPGDVVVSWLPLYHDMGLIGTWLAPLCFGLPVAILSPLAFLSRPERWLWALHHHRGTISAAPNFAYELCVRKVDARDIEGLDLSAWRAALNGAEPVSPQTVDRFAARFARYRFRREALMPVYGLAEATLAVTIPTPGRGPRVDRVERDVFERQGCAVPANPNDSSALAFVSVGHPLPRHEVRIVDANGEDVGERAEGYLWFRGPSAASGYYRNAKATRAILRESDDSTAWVDSGDRAYRADGEIYITGRVKDIIIKAGRNIYPHEVEEIAGGVEGIRKGCVAAFGITDAKAGTERMVVVAESRASDPVERARLAAEVREGIAAALDLPPDIVEVVPPQTIPKTSSGKLRREETKRLYVTGKLAAASHKPPAWVQVARLAATGGVRTTWNWIRGALTKLYGIYALAVFAILFVPTWLLVRVAPRRAAASITQWATRLCLTLAGCRPRVEGREHLNAPGPWVFVANHTSYLDALILLATLPLNARFVAKLELGSMPFFGTFIRKLGHFIFDRSDRQARLRQVDEIEEMLRRGESVVVFPEGTFTPAAGVRPFQLGAFKAAVVTGRPVCPVALRGAREILRDETYLPRPARVTLTICPPLVPATTPEDSGWQEIVRLRDAARATIARHSGEPLL